MSDAEASLDHTRAALCALITGEENSYGSDTASDEMWAQGEPNSISQELNAPQDNEEGAEEEFSVRDAVFAALDGMQAEAARQRRLAREPEVSHRPEARWAIYRERGWLQLDPETDGQEAPVFAVDDARLLDYLWTEQPLTVEISDAFMRAVRDKALYCRRYRGGRSGPGIKAALIWRRLINARCRGAKLHLHFSDRPGAYPSPELALDLTRFEEWEGDETFLFELVNRAGAVLGLSGSWGLLGENLDMHGGGARLLNRRLFGRLQVLSRKVSLLDLDASVPDGLRANLWLDLLRDRQNLIGRHGAVAMPDLQRLPEDEAEWLHLRAWQMGVAGLKAPMREAAAVSRRSGHALKALFAQV